MNWDGSRLAIAVRGDGHPEIVVLSRLDSRVDTLTIELPQTMDGMIPESVTLAGGALFFIAEDEDSIRSVFRVELDVDSPEPELLSGPHQTTNDVFASSATSVAFQAGDDKDELDVWVANSFGPVLNLTRSPANFVEHTLREERLAISHDGAKVAYNLEIESEPEVFIHPISTPGSVGRVHITHDAKFNPYIDQQVFILFDSEDRLYFDAGHSPGSTDLFRIGGETHLNAANLSQTGTGVSPPFLTRGDLSFENVTIGAGDLIVYSASGFSGTGTDVVGASAVTGETLFAGGGLSNPADFFTLGNDLYFVAAAGLTEQRLMRASASTLETVVSSQSAEPEVRVVSRSARRALVHEAETGLVVLSADNPTQVVADSEALPDATWVPSRAGEWLVFGVLEGDSAGYFARDLDSGVQSRVARSVTGSLIAVSGTPELESEFLRGDSNGDGSFDVSDPVSTLIFLFQSLSTPPCKDALDSNDDGSVNLTDPIYSIHSLLLSGEPPPAPFPTSGRDPTPDDLRCLTPFD